jgi:hypothetical protein
MSMRRMVYLSGALLVMIGLAATLTGCGGGGAQETLPTGEVKIEPPANSASGAGSVQDEYKNMAPAGKTK